jgi:hypothetical protein
LSVGLLLCDLHYQRRLEKRIDVVLGIAFKEKLGDQRFVARMRDLIMNVRRAPEAMFLLAAVGLASARNTSPATPVAAKPRLACFKKSRRVNSLIVPPFSKMIFDIENKDRLSPTVLHHPL